MIRNKLLFDLACQSFSGPTIRCIEVDMKSSFLKFVFVLILALFPSISSAQVPGQPANSWVYKTNWYCNDGFQEAGNQCVSIFGGSSNSGYSSAKSSPNPVYQSQPIAPSCAENGSCYGDVSANTGRAKTVPVQGYYRKDGTYVRGHYRSKGN